MLGHSCTIRRCSQFVPSHSSPLAPLQKSFQKFLEYHHSTLVLTGAGVSTESGIPDYRSEKVGAFARTSYKPITYREFLNDSGARTRFWARNFVGWPKFSSFKPNRVHYFIAMMQGYKKGVKLITQNVDGLHTKAGSAEVLELHGNAFWVRCIDCHETISRYDFQKMMTNLNPNFDITSTEMRPDGDVHIPPECIKDFKVPYCEKCGNLYKPTVTFFGQNVPVKIAEKAEALVDKCDSMLVLGTTLSTLSCYKLVEKAYDEGKFICLINIGPTKGDNLADLCIKAKISDVIFNTPKNEFQYVDG